MTDRDKHRVPWREVLHGLIALSGWILFVYWWGRVLPGVGAADPFVALAFIALTALGTAAATIAWVLYNIDIFRRKGPRRTLPSVSESHDRDILGRKIGMDPAAVKNSGIVVVSVEGDKKQFQVPLGA